MASSSTDVPYNHATENILFGQNVIEKISDTCLGQDGKRYYQVKWRDSWEPEERLMAAAEGALQAFWKEYYSNVEKEIRKQVVNASKSIPESIHISTASSLDSNIQNVNSLVTNVAPEGAAIVSNFPEQSSTVAYYAVQDNEVLDGNDQKPEVVQNIQKRDADQQLNKTTEELENQQLQQDLQSQTFNQVDIITSNLNNPEIVQHEIGSASIQQADEINTQAEILTQIINSQNGLPATKWIEDKISRRTLTTVTADTLNTKIVNGPDANSKFHCDICLKPFVSKRNVQRHMLTHTGEKPWMCEYCFKRFRQKPHLEQHVNIHKGIKNSVCEICGKAFNHRSNLVTHMATHSDNRPFVCEICGENFKLKHTLAKHTMVHSKQDIDRRHQCQVCKRSFRDKSYLAEHETIHQKDKPWKCDICLKTFSFKRRYQMHLEIHQSKDGGNEYICHLCPKQFKSKVYLQKHLERHDNKRRRKKRRKLKEKAEEEGKEAGIEADEVESLEEDENMPDDSDMKNEEELEEGETINMKNRQIIIEGNNASDELVMLPMNTLNMEEATYVALAQLTQAAVESAPMEESGNVILMSYNDIQQSIQGIQAQGEQGQTNSLQVIHAIQQEQQNAISSAIQHQGELQIITHAQDDQQNNPNIMQLQVQGENQQQTTIQLLASVPSGQHNNSTSNDNENSFIAHLEQHPVAHSSDTENSHQETNLSKNLVVDVDQSVDVANICIQQEN